MRVRAVRLTVWIGIAAFISLLVPFASAEVSPAIFNVKNYGATGKKSDNAQLAIQKAVDACTKAGGGEVYLPPGDYTSGTIHLSSHVTLDIDAGAVLFASDDDAVYDKPTLLYGEDLRDITIQGRGTIDGQGEYISQVSDYDDINIHDNRVLAQAAGKSLA